MGKKRKEEEGQETYEVWVSKDDGTWGRVVERGNDGIFSHKQRALAIAGSKSVEEGVVETLVIERRPIASFNGPSISLKGKLASAASKVNSSTSGEVEPKKEEEIHAGSVHGDRPEEGQVIDPGPGRPGEAGVPGPVREADPA
ncbi:MAG: hypothetical protein ACREDF_04030 [Thermoplasmata archaeon]